jgi:outer membrane murein-binding lipoprotein Lpp
MRLREHGRAAAVVAGAVVVSLLLAGCSADRTTKVDKSTDDASLRLAGPWAEDFRDALAHGVSDYEAGILADGQVTTAEVEDAHDRISRCLADSGYTIAYGADGGFEIGSLRGGAPSNDMKRTNSVLEACEEKYDEYVTMLFQETRRNPEKQDEAKITVACLRKAGIVGKDYTERKWQSEYDDGVFSFNDFDPRAQQCDLDPLGLWRDG